MERISQEYILSIIFKQCLEREELLCEKYDFYIETLKDKDLIQMLKDDKSTASQHIKMLKNKMIKLNIQG